MSYSYTVERPSYSRVAAAALLAVSAGACLGVALSFTPAVSSLYAPVAVRPVVASQMSALNVPRTQMQAANDQYIAQQYIPTQMAEAPIQTSQVNGWAVLSGGLFAAAAAMVAIVFKGSKAETSEQIAMLAASGKKKVAAAPKRSAPRGADDRELWYPNAEAPAWLNGSLPGDRGFDPFGLSKPVEYVQYELDGLDQNAAKNRIGKVVGRVRAQPDQVSGEALAPYSEVFGLNRFRECEVIHGRWAMLFVLGALVGESVTGVNWQDAGLFEVTNGATYFGYSLPFTSSQITWFEVLTMGFVEIYRNTELNTEKRVYPGGAFDPLGLASGSDAFRLKEAEIKHGRLAMIAFLGFAAAAFRTGEGATEAFANWAVNIA